MNEIKAIEKKYNIKWGRVGIWLIVVLYLVFPIDFLPEAIFGPIAFSDDALILVLKIIEEIVNARKAKKVDSSAD